MFHSRRSDLTFKRRGEGWYGWFGSFRSFIFPAQLIRLKAVEGLAARYCGKQNFLLKVSELGFNDAQTQRHRHRTAIVWDFKNTLLLTGKTCKLWICQPRHRFNISTLCWRLGSVVCLWGTGRLHQEWVPYFRTLAASAALLCVSNRSDCFKISFFLSPFRSCCLCTVLSKTQLKTPVAGENTGNRFRNRFAWLATGA